jgi:hypothetical protein
MHTWVFVLWLLTPGTPTTPATHTPVVGTATTKLRCETDLIQHLQAEGHTIVAVSRCVEMTPWLRVVRP